VKLALRSTIRANDVTPQVFSSIIALHCMSISMHHFMLFYVIATIVIVFRILLDSHHVKFRELV
jgi:hypothetical protein